MINIFIIILIAILALGIFFAIIKKAIKFAIYAIVIVIIGSVIIMIIIANDISSFKEKSENGVAFLFSSGGNIVKGYFLKNDETPKSISEDEINNLEDKINNNESDKITELIIVTELNNSFNMNEIDNKLKEFSSSINLIKSIKSGATKIYPEKISTKALKYIPKIVIERRND